MTTEPKSAHALSAAEFRAMARELIPETAKELRRLAFSADPTIAAEARKLLDWVEAQGDIHLSNTSTELNTIRGNQDVNRR